MTKKTTQKQERRVPSPASNGSPLTCISGGPLIGVGTGGKVMVRAVEAEERTLPMVAAFLADDNCGQMVGAWPTIGVTRDYRKASLEAVCKALELQGRPFVRERAMSTKDDQRSDLLAPPTGYSSAPVAVALLEMRRCLAMIEHETASARREEGLGGWLSDHTGCVAFWNDAFETAKGEAQRHIVQHQRPPTEGVHNG